MRMKAQPSAVNLREPARALGAPGSDPSAEGVPWKRANQRRPGHRSPEEESCPPKGGKAEPREIRANVFLRNVGRLL